MKQTTIKNEISFCGIGLHSGVNTNITIKPAGANAGIVFRRVDIKDKKNEIKATYNNVINTNLGTTIGLSNSFQKFLSKNLLKIGILKEFGVVVRTIEHFMASLWACNIDNAIIEINNKEIPILDGSSDLFIKEIQKAGIEELNEERKYLIVKKEVEIETNFSSIKLIPYDGFKIDINIDFNYGGIGSQTYHFDGKQETFLNEISQARTFCNYKDVEFMQKHGLALGGSLKNAMVFNDVELLNTEGYRLENEPVRHKLLDCIGDMFTSGYFMKCHIITNRGGHTLNNRILKELFKNKENFEIK